MPRAAANPLEKVIETKVCDHAKQCGCIQYKFTSPSRRSVPDRIFIMPGGGVFFIEFKRRGEKPTPAQEIEIAKLRKQGAKVFVIDNIDRGRALIADMLHSAPNIETLYPDPAAKSIMRQFMDAGPDIRGAKAPGAKKRRGSKSATMQDPFF